jgi:hypothetical protein
MPPVPSAGDPDGGWCVGGLGCQGDLADIKPPIAKKMLKKLSFPRKFEYTMLILLNKSAHPA